MTPHPTRTPTFDRVETILRDLSQAQGTDVADLVTVGLSQAQGVALARLWRLRLDPACPRCSESRDTPRLHLDSETGTTRTDNADLRGRDQCIALGSGKVGHIGSTGEPVHVEDDLARSTWTARPEWVRREQLRGFGGVPIRAGDTVLGVLAVYTRAGMSAEAMRWLTMVADHTAAALERARRSIERESALRSLERLDRYYQVVAGRRPALSAPAGVSSHMVRVRAQIDLITAASTPAWIFGERGTGKTRLARFVHETASPSGRFVVVEGADLRTGSAGRELSPADWLAVAGGGTLILENVEEWPLAGQRSWVEALAALDSAAPDAPRWVTATSRLDPRGIDPHRLDPRLRNEVEVVSIELLPLRERHEDIAPLADRMLDEEALALGLAPPPLGPAEHRQLERRQWPGNAAELRAQLRLRILGQRGVEAPILTEEALRDLERSNLQAVLARTGGKVSGPDGAAALLGVPATTLASRIRRFGLDRAGSE